mgnify:CR=1 FL=1
MNVIEKVFGTHSERELKLIRPIVAKIESLRPEMVAKSDEELRDQTRIFKERLGKLPWTIFCLRRLPLSVRRQEER